MSRRIVPSFSTDHEISARVLGGLPVLVKFTIQPSDPSVGVMHSAAVDLALYTVKGKPAPWAERRLTSDDWDRLAAECEEDAASERDWY